MKHFFLTTSNLFTPIKDNMIAELRIKANECVTKEDFSDIFEDEITFTRRSIYWSQSLIRKMPLMCLFSIVFFVGNFIFTESSDILLIFFTLTVSSLGIMIMLSPQYRIKEQKSYLQYLHSLKRKNLESLKDEFTSKYSDFSPKAQFNGENKELCVMFKNGGFQIKNERAFFAAISRIISDKNGEQFKELHKTFNKLDSDGYTDQLKSLQEKFKN